MNKSYCNETFEILVAVNALTDFDPATSVVYIGALYTYTLLRKGYYPYYRSSLSILFSSSHTHSASYLFSFPIIGLLHTCFDLRFLSSQIRSHIMFTYAKVRGSLVPRNDYIKFYF